MVCPRWGGRPWKGVSSSLYSLWHAKRGHKAACKRGVG